MTERYSISLRVHGRVFLTGMVMVLAAGCGAPWTVVTRSGPPSALRGANPLVADADFTQATMDGVPIAQAIGALPANEQSDVQTMLADLQQTFITELASDVPVQVVTSNGPLAPGEVRVTMRAIDIARGGHSPFSPPSSLTVRISFSVGGQITDEVEMTRRMNWAVTRPSAARRLRGLATQMAQMGARFFRREQSR